LHLRRSRPTSSLRMPRPGFSSRTLIGSFVVVAAAFIAATATSEIADVEIRRAAESISTNSASSVFQLSSMRSSLRRFEVLIDDYVDQDPIRKIGRTDIVRLRDDMVRSWATYRQLPTYPGEREAWTRVDDRLQGVEVLISDLLDVVARG